MTIDWWTLGLETVNVLILLWILARYLFRPVAKIIAERQAAATEPLDKARAALAEAEAQRAAARAETEALVAKRAALIAEASDEAAREKTALMAEAQTEADKARTIARAALARQAEAETRALSGQAAVLATDIAARLMARLPESARVAGFIDGLAKAVGELPETTRAGIGATGPVALRAARAPSGDETERLRQRLTEVLGRAVNLEISADPELIAGLELDAPHAIVRNHFRADLDRIKAELVPHD